MSLLHHAQQVGARLEELGEARRYDEEAQALNNKLDLLRTQRSALEYAVRVAAVLAANEALDRSELPETAKPMDSLAKVTEAFVGDSRTLASGRAFKTLLRQLESTTAAVNDVTSAAWQAATRTAPRPNERLLNRIEQIPAQANKVQELRAVAAKLAAVTRAPAASQEEWDNYAGLRARVEQLVGTLNADRFPQVVLDFCKQAQSREGAPLELLTPEVQQWLEDNEMYQDLRLRLL